MMKIASYIITFSVFTNIIGFYGNRTHGTLHVRINLEIKFLLTAAMPNISVPKQILSVSMAIKNSIWRSLHVNWIYTIDVLFSYKTIKTD